MMAPCQNCKQSMKVDEPWTHRCPADNANVSEIVDKMCETFDDLTDDERLDVIRRVSRYYHLDVRGCGRKLVEERGEVCHCENDE